MCATCEPGQHCCRACGSVIVADQRHSYVDRTQPQHGHYCFGCEPPGALCWTFPVKIEPGVIVS